MKQHFLNESNNGRYTSDLACERHRADTSIPGVTYKKETSGPFTWERIEISSHEGEIAIQRPRGSYDTLSTERMDLLDEEEIGDAANEIAGELCRIFEKTSVIPTRILVVGLGNPSLTPDSVGPRAAELVNATLHLYEDDSNAFKNLECSEIAVFTPGVMANTGLESSDTVSALCDIIEPDAVIAVDAIASRSPSRLGTTGQISNTGIFPGSGIGNKRKAIGERTLGIPVIAIGVPTVISASAFCASENEEGESYEDMFVSPRDIDTIVNASARIISGGINQAFGIF